MEMTIEEKAKAYDEAIKRGLDYIRHTPATEMVTRQDIFEAIFPELKESEGGIKDEKIRKWIMTELQNHLFDVSQYYSDKDSVTLKRRECLTNAITWLEKQGEQKYTKKDVDDAYLKGVCDTKARIWKQDEQKPYGLREECKDCQCNYVGECNGSCAMKRNEQKVLGKSTLAYVNNINRGESPWLDSDMELTYEDGMKAGANYVLEQIEKCVQGDLNSHSPFKLRCIKQIIEELKEK